MADLKEGQNNVEIIGTVKKINIEEKVSKKGKEMIMGDVIIEVKDGNKINNIKVKLLSMKMNKKGEISGLFKGYKTVKDEWKVGDRARVTGSISINEYYGGDGELRSFNEVRGLFLNRLEGEDAKKPDKSIATVEMVIEGMTSELDEENIPTGNLEVEAFTVGYNSAIIPLKNMIITEALATTFQNMYVPGTTGKITFKINNYAEVTKEEVAPEAQAGFGATERVEDNVVTNYNNNLEIIGGDLPYNDGVNEYSQKEIQQAQRNRQLALQELKQQNSAPDTPQAAGFGNNGSANTQNNSKADDLTKAFTNQPAEDLNDGDTPAF